MGFLQRLMGNASGAGAPSNEIMVSGPVGPAFDLSSAAVVEMLARSVGSSGIRVTVADALENTTVFRCVDLISGSMAMMPVNIHRETPEGDFVKASDHPLHLIFRRRPNSWQTPFEFKGLMQYRALTHDKGAVALIVKSRGRILELIPLDPDRVSIEIVEDAQVRYTYTRKSGGKITLRRDEVFHLRGLTFDGINGISRVRKSAKAIAIAIAAERATAALFRNGTFASGVLEIPQELSEAAFARVKSEWRDRHQGPENAGNTPIMEGGAKYVPFALSARDAQSVEARRFQVEEILRVFGVPRPLAMVDDTGWGTGIEQLSIGFVRFGLNPWIRAWEESIDRMIDDADIDLSAKFNPGALLNGTMKDQYDAFAKAAGAGGHQPWNTPNEIRRFLNQPRHPDGDKLGSPTGSTEQAPDPDAAAEAQVEKLLAHRKPLEGPDHDED